MSEHKVKAWQAEGIIDAATAERILAWEAEHTRPLMLWAVIGLAALSIGLGVISVVAANWDAIPVPVRLAVHFVLLAAAAAALFVLAGRRGSPWREEALLFVFGALGLSFFGHLGQAYQTTSPMWQPLAAWLALFCPLFLLRGQSWPTATALAGALVIAVWDFAPRDDQRSYAGALFALPTALPIGLAVLGAAMRRRSSRIWFWRRVEELGFAYALGGATLLAILAGMDDSIRQDAGDMQVLLVWAAAAFAAAGAVYVLRRDASGRAAAAVLAGCGAAALLAWPLSGSQVIGALLFGALWALVAAMAIKGQWRGVFRLAVAMLALRLIVLSFELADDLLTSGAGLIVAGLLILGVAWAAVRVARRFAPPKAAAEGDLP